MRICIIADANSEHIIRLTQYLVAHNHEVHLISWKKGHDLPLSVCTYILRSSRFPLFREFSWLLQIKRLILSIQPDIVDGHYITTNGFAAAFSGFHPLVVTAWGSDLLINPWQNPFWKFTAKYALNHADKIACLFPIDIAKDKLGSLNITLSKVETYYLGVDTTEFRYINDNGLMKTNLGINASSPVVINPRGLSPVYDINTFIKAIPVVLKRIPKAKFIILLSKEEKQTINNLKMDSSILESVIFLERIPHSKIPFLFSMADVYVSSSISDGASNALFEAMACGLATVVTDIQANRYWIRDGENGFLFEPGDYTSLADKVINILQNHEKRKIFSCKSRDIVCDKAEQNIQMKKIESIYRDLIDDRS
jgi:L-malate glycosyltransferase